MRTRLESLLGRRGRAGLIVAAVVAGTTLATMGAASASDVPPSPPFSGCPGGTHTEFVPSGDDFGAWTWVWVDGFSTTHGDGATYQVTRSLDGQDVNEGDWSYWC